ILTIAVTLVIAVQPSCANRHGAPVLSDDVLDSLDPRIAERVLNDFSSPTRASSIGETLAEGEPPAERRRALVEKFSIGALKETAQSADFTFGDKDGNSMMARRNNAGAIDTKLVQNAAGARTVLWIRRNTAGKEIGRDEDLTDTFDPRT